MIPNTANIGYDCRSWILKRQPIEKFAIVGSRPGPNITPPVLIHNCGLQTVSQEVSDYGIGKERHSAVGVVNNKEFLSPQKLIGDHERPDRVIASAPTRIPDHVGITFREPGKFGRVEPCIHAGKNRKFSSRGNRQGALIAEPCGVTCICFEHFLEDL